MVSIATCPQCARQLAVPETASSDDPAECPLCGATFLLANARQQDLPAARIVCQVESPEVPVVETAAAETFVTPGELTPETAGEVTDISSLPSWEARLKRAIETDSIESEASAEVESQPIEQPEFEFHLDPPAQAETFAPDLVSPTNHEELSVALQVASQRRSPRRPWVKMAAVIAGPGLLGTFLGLFALLWMRGPSADFVGLANYLPASLLPTTAPMTEEPRMMLEEQEQLASAQPIDDALPEVVPPLPPLVLRDESVQTTAAEQPISTLPAASELSVDQLGGLVIAARNALPRFAEGDLSTRESISRKGQAYMALCQLAEQFFLSHQPSAEMQDAKVVFGRVLANAETKDDLTTIASRWWGHSGRLNQGIVFAGHVESAQPVGNRTLCFVMLDGQAASDAIPVLVQRSTVTIGRRIGVVGQIAVAGDDELMSLGIDLPQVVVSQHSYELP